MVIYSETLMGFGTGMFPSGLIERLFRHLIRLALPEVVQEGKSLILPTESVDVTYVAAEFFRFAALIRENADYYAHGALLAMMKAVAVIPAWSEDEEPLPDLSKVYGTSYMPGGFLVEHVRLHVPAPSQPLFIYFVVTTFG